jgi:hypothetical protein
MNFRPLLNRIDNIHAQEIALYSDHLRLLVALTVLLSLMASYQSLILKPLKSQRKKSGLKTTLLRLQAYAIMYEERTGIPINRSVIMIAVEGDDPQIFVEKRDNFVPLLLSKQEIFGNLKITLDIFLTNL